MSNAAVTAPSLVRLKRVLYFLEREPRYKEKFAEGEQVYEKQTSTGVEKIPFPAVIWRVAEAIQAAGGDACQMDRAHVQTWADHVIFGKVAPNAPTQSLPAALAPVVQTAPAKTEEDSTPSAASESPAEDGANVLPTGVDVRIAIYTLLLSCMELTRLDRKPGAEALSAKLEAVAKDYRMTFVPRKA